MPSDANHLMTVEPARRGPRPGSGLIDLMQHRFGRLVVLRLIGRKSSATWWLCRCDCGKETPCRAGDLRNGHTQSCGCLLRDVLTVIKKKHGLKGRIPEYYVWQGMWQRCTNPRHTGYKNYGGRGIKVCERWRSFASFLDDMGRRPHDKLTIERVDNWGNYEPTNCVWDTRKAQAANSRRWL